MRETSVGDLMSIGEAEGRERWRYYICILDLLCLWGRIMQEETAVTARNAGCSGCGWRRAGREGKVRKSNLLEDGVRLCLVEVEKCQGGDGLRRCFGEVLETLGSSAGEL